MTGCLTGKKIITKTITHKIQFKIPVITDDEYSDNKNYKSDNETKQIVTPI